MYSIPQNPRKTMKRSYGELSGVASAHPVLSDTVEATGAVVKQEAVPEKREAAPAELSSGQPKPKRSTKPRASNALLRKGKWTVSTCRSMGGVLQIRMSRIDVEISLFWCREPN